MGKLSLYAVAAAGLIWSLFAYGRFVFLRTPSPMLLVSIAVLVVAACALVRYDVETMFGEALDRSGRKRTVTPIVGQAIVRRFLSPALIVVTLLVSHVCVGRFAFGQDAVPMLLVLSVVLVASVCGLINRDAQIAIGKRA
jgi:hypothetical protein